MTATYFVLHSEEMQITMFPTENKYVSEHIPRMTSCEVISEGFWENSMKPRQGPCNLSFFKNMKLFRNYAFVLLPGMDRKSYQMWVGLLHYSLQLAIFVCSYVFMQKHDLASAVWPSDCTFPHVTLLHHQNLNFLMLKIQLIIAWDFSPAHLLAPLSQFPLHLEK